MPFSSMILCQECYKHRLYCKVQSALLCLKDGKMLFVTSQDAARERESLHDDKLIGWKMCPSGGECTKMQQS